MFAPFPFSARIPRALPAAILLLASCSCALTASFSPYRESFATESAIFPGADYPSWIFVDAGEQGTFASVENGQLRIAAGNGGEYSHGRASISSGSAIGLPEFPDTYSVSVSLGGGSGNPGTWSVALEVNRVWIGFYPGYENEQGKGHFYACFAEGYGELVSHLDMGFVPQPDVLYPIAVKVSRLGDADHRFRFDVVVKNPENEGEKFEKTFQADLPSGLFPIDSVSLWRVDAPGGDGIFSDLKIDP